jgi:hypothetical protein
MRRSKQYVLVDGVLMRKNAKEEVLMKCITWEAGIQLLHEIHSGTCSNHAASRTLVAKLSEQVSTGRLSWPMQRSWFAAATNVNFSPNVYTYQHIRSRPYQLPGPLHAGDWIWLVLSSRPLAISNVSSCWLTSFPNRSSTCL